MSAKTPKSDSRNTLPRSPSQLSPPTPTSTAKTEKTNGASSSTPVTSVAFQNEEDHFPTGFLSLKDLNDLLCKYIDRVHDLEFTKEKPDTPSLTINIDRTEITELSKTYTDQLEDWKKQCQEKDKKKAELEALLAKLEAEIEKLKESNSKKDKIINEKDKAIADLNNTNGKLEAEVASLQAKFASANTGYENTKKILEKELAQLGEEKLYFDNKLKDMTSKFSAERNRSSDLASRLESLERELWFKIKVLTGELEIEKEKSLSQTKIDISAVDKKIKGEYASRLQEELQILRRVYEQHMEKNKEYLEMRYQKKISDLEMDKDAAYKAEIMSKETRISYLTKQNQEYKKMYDELWSKYSSDEQEVKVYNRLITPEVDRISRRSSRARYQHGSDGEVDGSSSEDEGQTLKASVTTGVKKVVNETVKKVETLQKAVSSTGKKE